MASASDGVPAALQWSRPCRLADGSLAAADGFGQQARFCQFIGLQCVARSFVGCCTESPASASAQDQAVAWPVCLLLGDAMWGTCFKGLVARMACLVCCQDVCKVQAGRSWAVGLLLPLEQHSVECGALRAVHVLQWSFGSFKDKACGVCMIDC